MFNYMSTDKRHNMTPFNISILAGIAINLGLIIYILVSSKQQQKHSQEQSRSINANLDQLKGHYENKQILETQLHQTVSENKQMLNMLQQKQEHLQKTISSEMSQNILQQQNTLRQIMQDIRNQLTTTLNQQNHTTCQQITQLQKTVDQHLHHIAGQVEKKLSDGFAKTNTLFTDVMTRLALIDKAQQEINDLSSNVVSLQDILKNKQARGHFGEIQLNQLVKNCLPEKHFAFQHTFKNGKRADCVLFLPEPTGTIAIDAKFPLDNYRLSCNAVDLTTKNKAKALFKQDMKIHIKHVAEKYIIPDETCQAAVLFIPAESIFSDIHSYHEDLIDFAYQRKVWLVSPTTMMAILHTTQAVLKDIQTQAQVDIIKEHLQHLSNDFNRFQDRMNSVAKHINEANTKVSQVNISANKISKRFKQIENADLKPKESLSPALDLTEIST